MLKVGDKIKIIDYGLFFIKPETRKECYVISTIYEDNGYEFVVDKDFTQMFCGEHIGKYVEKIED